MQSLNSDPFIDSSCIHFEDGRFAALVAVPNCPKESHYFAFKKATARFAPVVVVPNCCLKYFGRFAAVVVVPNCSPIPESSRFAALVAVPNCPKESHYFAFKKATASRP